MAATPTSPARPDIAAFFEQRFRKPSNADGSGYGSGMPASYDDAVQSHPFVHQAHYHTTLNTNGIIRDGDGTVVGVFMKAVLPVKSTKLADEVLRAAATRTSLRASIFGGTSPLSGIAGYFDYAGSPIEYKCRKTSYTCETIKAWPKVYPMVEYANALYRALKPDEWAKQNKAIPDVVRIRNTVFSTLTINQRFRTAQHTDAGDFDEGFGVITCMNGEFDGLNLGFPRLGVCVRLEPGDVLLFNTHHYHANTELERVSEYGDNGFIDWSRMTCVFYYRANLGDPRCWKEYSRRHAEALKGEKAYAADAAAAVGKEEDKLSNKEEAAVAVVAALKRFGKALPPNDNGVNLNRPASVVVPRASPFGGLLTSADSSQHLGIPAESLQVLQVLHDALSTRTAFGDYDVNEGQTIAVLGGYRHDLSQRLRLEALSVRVLKATDGSDASTWWNASTDDGGDSDDDAKAFAARVNQTLFGSAGAVPVAHLLHDLLFDEPSYADVPAGLEERAEAKAKKGGAAAKASAEAVAKQAFFAKKKPSDADVTEPTLPRRCVHRVLTLLRGEAPATPRPSAIPAGLEPRADVELARVNLDTGHNIGEYNSKLGGFSEAPSMIDHGAKNHEFLTDSVLKDVIPAGLFEKWTAARTAWLDVVLEDWKKMLKLNPNRSDFNWNNRGPISTTFFALCDVGHQVMQEILQKDEPSPSEKSRFWLAYAFHLFELCQTRNKMPETAMSMKKLNVKLKDHKFGGTRYFEDQSPEEQERRLKRKQRIAEARALGLTGRKREGDEDDDEGLETWLDNDRFDYQSEDAPVVYSEANELPPPEAVGAAIGAWFRAHDATLAASTRMTEARKTHRAEAAAVADASHHSSATKKRVLVITCRSESDSTNADALQRLGQKLQAVVQDPKVGRDGAVQLWRRLACDAETSALVAAFIHRCKPKSEARDTAIASLSARISAFGTQLRRELRVLGTAKAEERAAAEARELNPESAAKPKKGSAAAAAPPRPAVLDQATVETAAQLTQLLLAAIAEGRESPAVDATTAATVMDWTLRCALQVPDASRMEENAHTWGIIRVAASVAQLRALVARGALGTESTYHLAVLVGAGGVAMASGDVYGPWRDVVVPLLKRSTPTAVGALLAIEHDPQDLHHFMLPQATRTAAQPLNAIAVALLTMLSRSSDGSDPLDADLPTQLRTRHELEASVVARVPSEQRPRLPGFLSLYQLPRSPLGSYVAVLPEATINVAPPAAPQPAAAAVVAA